MKLCQPSFALIALSFFVSNCSDRDASSPRATVFYRAYKIEPAPVDSSGLFPEGTQTIQEFLSEIGVAFHEPNSAVITGLEFPGFGMRNTAKNHEILTQALDKRHPGRWLVVEDEPES